MTQILKISIAYAVEDEDDDQSEHLDVIIKGNKFTVR